MYVFLFLISFLILTLSPKVKRVFETIFGILSFFTAADDPCSSLDVCLILFYYFAIENTKLTLEFMPIFTKIWLNSSNFAFK